MHQITVESIGIGNQIEWSERVEAGNKSAATRKANKIVRDCGASTNDVEKTTNQYDGSIETWTLK